MTRSKPRKRAPGETGSLALFGAFLAQRRRTLGITQLDLADLADVGVASVRTLEAGKSSPTLAITLRVLNALGLSLVSMSHADVHTLDTDAVELQNVRHARH